MHPSTSRLSRQVSLADPLAQPTNGYKITSVSATAGAGEVDDADDDPYQREKPGRGDRVGHNAVLAEAQPCRAEPDAEAYRPLCWRRRCAGSPGRPSVGSGQ